MDRRTFCASGAAFAAGARFGFGQAAVDGDAVTLWSMLVPMLQIDPGKGYMVEQKSGVPDALPALFPVGVETPIRQAMNRSRTGNYGVDVPDEWKAAFGEAVADASARKNEIAEVRNLNGLKKPCRYLSEDEVKEYRSLSPHVVAANWKPDPRILKEYSGWGAVSRVSVPYFDRKRSMAMVWASTESGCLSLGWTYFLRSSAGWNVQRWRADSTAECA